MDPKSNKMFIHNWKPAYELLQRIIAIPGNAPQGKVKRFDKDPFFKDKSVSMIATTNMLDRFAKTDMNWDMVTYPQYKDHKGTFGVAGARPLMISSSSQHKDAAFQVIQTVLSDGVEKILSKAGTVPTLTSTAVQKVFAADLPYTKGKNIAAAFKLKPGWRVLSKYDDIAGKVVFAHSVDLYSGKDINTVIRETEEDLTAQIQEADRK
jgi:multiple sugar transport system substrate-binding protein